MSRLVWDAAGERLYETGVKMGVIYPQNSSGAYPEGVAWNGLTSVSESPSGADANPFYADDTKYIELRSAEEFGGTIEAYTYPPEFAVCDGTAELMTGVLVGQQTRKPFGLCYRTIIGNDTDSNDHGYKLHLVYNATASPSEKQYQTVNDSPELITFSWEFTTTPIPVTGHKNASTIVIDSTKVDAAKLAVLEGVLYGLDAVEANANANPPVAAVTATTARLPLPDEVKYILTNGSLPT